ALNLEVNVAVLKGRSNYLCPRRLESSRQRGPDNPEEMRVLAKVLVWLNEGGSGDRTEINLNGPIEREIWMRLSAEDEGCKAETCMTRAGGGCPFYNARQAAQAAHLVIVNHALLLADVSTGNRVLPEYSFLIIDEAHHLESATTNALSYRVAQGDLGRLLRELGGSSSGSVGRLLTMFKNILRPSDFAAANVAAARATDLAFRLDHDFRELFNTVNQFMADQRDGRPVGPYGHQERLLPASRTLPAWGEVEMAWDTTRETLKLLLNLLADMHKSASQYQDDVLELEDELSTLANIHRRLDEAEKNISGLVDKPVADFIYWIEIAPNNTHVIMQIAPLHIGPLMEQYLWHEKTCVILTSATLTTNGDFDYLRERLAAHEADELALGSPFDYENAAMLYLVNDIPEPSDANHYQRSVENTLVRVSKASGGRLLALFTSYAQLKRTSQAISPLLAEDGIQVYEQGEGASSNTLLEAFRDADKAVLLGTRAFWEGVDIPGDALSVLVIVRLPFDVPSDPIIAARSETFEDPFNEYSLPEAILRFRQGFGRLIRTQYDRGVVAVLDRRLLTKRYGKSFIQSLPECTLRQGSMHDLPAVTARWLNT
ncbi:MAG TPA: helicase C-terminal domain-containing protein, partial [Levilinea sp.]|nr:helicase C-terminal domain-containing protein [Levilinea sp.]